VVQLRLSSVQMQGERFERVVATQRRYSRDICCAWGTSLNSQAARSGPHCLENREAGHSLTSCGHAVMADRTAAGIEPCGRIDGRANAGD